MNNLLLIILFQLQENGLKDVFIYLETFNKGKNYADQDRVASWSWNKKNNNLNVVVQGTINYIVEIDYQDNFIYSCSCLEYKRSDECKHIACALITIIRVLNDSSYRPELNKTLESDFKDKSIIISDDIVNDLGFEIYLKLQDLGEKINYQIIKNKINSIPVFYKDILKKIDKADDFNSYVNSLTALITESVKDKILYLVTDDCLEIKPTEYDSSKELNKKLVFQYQDDGKCLVTTKLETSNGLLISNFKLLSYRHALDLDTKIIYNLSSKDDILYSNYYNFRTLFFEEDDISTIYENKLVSTCLNHNSNIIFAIDERDYLAFKKNIIFISKDDQVSIEFIDNFEYQVNISLINNKFYFALELNINKNFINVSFIFINVLKKIIKLTGFDNLFSLTFAHLFKLLVELESKDEFVSKALILLNNFFSRQIMNLAQEDLVSFLSIFKKNILEFLHEPIRIFYVDLNGNFCSVLIDRYKALKVSTDLALLLKSKNVLDFVGVDYLLINNDKNLTKNFKEILKTLKKENVSTFFNRKILKISSPTISIDASKKEFDWFEIKPEIKVDESFLADSEWLSMLELGQRETESSVELLDDESEKILNLIKKYTVSQNNNKINLIKNKPLRIFELLEFKNNGINLKLDPKDADVLDSLGKFKKVKKIPIPLELDANLRVYQQDGFSWLVFLYEHRFGACLADDMGLGKTIQAITFLGYVFEKKVNQQEKKINLIVVPPSLIFNWENELQKFYPKLKVASYFGFKRGDLPTDVDVIITTYDIVRIDQEKFEKEFFDVIIFDEAQVVKNLLSKRTSAVRSLNSNFKLCLTGTPLENNLKEFYSIMDLAIPGLFPDYDELKNLEKEELLNFIIERSKPFILRRKKEIIADELPEKIENDVYLLMSKNQKLLYQKIVGEIKKEIITAYGTKTSAQATIIVLTALLRLRQICVSSRLVVPNDTERSPKLEYLMEQLKELKASNSAALVFSQFTKCLDLIEEDLKKENIKYLRIDGSVSIKNRKIIVQTFQDPQSDIQVLLLSLKTGGIGLNLTRASYVFHIDPWWNPAVENQASDRAYRLGQKKQVIITRILMKHSIEEKMMGLKKEKSDLFAAVVEGSQVKFGKTLSKKDFDFLLS